MIRVVTIDFWNTIVDSSNGEPRRAFRAQALAEAFGAIGMAYTDDDTDKAFMIAHQAFEHSWRNEHRTIGAHEVLTIVWERMGVAIPAETHDRVAKAFQDSVLAGIPALLPGADEVIASLAEDHKLSIISDTALSPGSLLMKVLDHYDISRHFSHFVFSDEVGVAKPHVKAFQSALAPFGASPEEAVHIGDIERTDVDGAKNAGMRAILFRGDTESPSYKSYTGTTRADAIAESWAEVPAIIDEWNASFHPYEKQAVS